MFCNVGNADVSLNSASPLLADSATCGQIGARGVGCGTTPTLVQRFTAGRVSAGIRVIWEVADGATASEIWVERAEGVNGQAWTEPVMERLTAAVDQLPEDAHARLLIALQPPARPDTG